MSRGTLSRTPPASSASRLDFWRERVNAALPLAPTPFYLCSVEPLREAVAQLDAFSAAIPTPVRHWLSLKSQPIRPLLRWWRRRKRPVEVVSEFELMAALREGFAPEDILVNGPAKHRWLPQRSVPGLRVNFDSLSEMVALLPVACAHRWSVGLRCRVDGLGQTPQSAGHFGLLAPEAELACRRLSKARVPLEAIHVHCGTQVRSHQVYAEAFNQVAAICRSARLAPKYLDCGGGWPGPNVRSLDGQPIDAAFDLPELARLYRESLSRFPSLQELWLENGRFVSARSGVLVVRVLDMKPIGPLRHVICDGGRTMNALISTWETHDLIPLRPQSGAASEALVLGPTCMAFDELARCQLPCELAPGDFLIWMDAGAYHIPWETRFSHGHAAVLWDEDGSIRVAREGQTFEQWWGEWRD